MLLGWCGECGEKTEAGTKWLLVGERNPGDKANLLAVKGHRFLLLGARCGEALLHVPGDMSCKGYLSPPHCPLHPTLQGYLGQPALPTFLKSFSLHLSSCAGQSYLPVPSMLRRSSFVPK